MFSPFPFTEINVCMYVCGVLTRRVGCDEAAAGDVVGVAAEPQPDGERQRVAWRRLTATVAADELSRGEVRTSTQLHAITAAVRRPLQVEGTTRRFTRARRNFDTRTVSGAPRISFWRYKSTP